MNSVPICDHSVDIDRLPEHPAVLDVGCRGFGFAKSFADRGARVIALDPDPEISDPRINDVTFLHLALTCHYGHAVYRRNSGDDGEIIAAVLRLPGTVSVPCVDIETLSTILGVDHWDVVKLDCEGSEFGILENWSGPIADQISVEFHDYRDRRRWGRNYFERLWKVLPWYEVAQHREFPVGPNNMMGHWDTLLVRK